jgi:hypothetical protein
MSEVAGIGSTSAVPAQEEARHLAGVLVDLTEQPDDFCLALETGLRSLHDPAYTRLVERASPGVSGELAVRRPLVDRILRPLERALAEGSSVSALRLGDRLIESPHRDVRLFALPALRRALAEDPELTWQLMRRMGRAAADWIEVDSLADVWARGVLAEAFRWAELEQLVYSQHPYERRLVGATLATIPSRTPPQRRAELRDDAGRHALPIIAMLIGDAAAPVQKALSWAIRAWTPIDPIGVLALLRAETATSVRTDDGARAWVIRDALSAQPPHIAADLRSRLAGLRRDGSAPSTSIAAGQAIGFASVLAASADTAASQGERYTRRRA